MNLRVLYVDDLLPLLRSVRHILQSHSSDPSPLNSSGDTFTIEIFSKTADVLSRMKNHDLPEPHIVLLDIVIDDNNSAGLILATQARKTWKDAVIVMFSQFDDADTIVQYMAAGADNFLSKEIDLSTLPKTLREYYDVTLKKRKGADFHQETTPHPPHISGETMYQISERVPRLLKSAVRAIHVYGETGTGKEVVADVFEYWIGTKLPFVRVNCGALSPTLLESELFGHVKGSFTGAVSDKIGFIEAASGGWLFLDEVALLSTSAQRALLRALENQEITRIGETRTRKVNIKLHSATNENLDKKCQDGSFRQDLFQRLKELEIYLPPLRDRMEEIPALSLHFCTTMEGGPYQLVPTTVDVLKRYSWDRGNIRELRNCLRAMTEYSTNNLLTPASIPRNIFESIHSQKEIKPVVSSAIDIKISVDFTKSVSFSDLENQLLVKLVTLACQSQEINSLRALETKIGFARITLTKRLRELLRTGLLDPKVLSADLYQSLNMGQSKKSSD